MGLFFKKGFNIGPVRINFSKSGVGCSVGHKGMRVGTGPKGNYVHAGRHGLYYRKSLGWGVAVVLALAALVYWAVATGVITISF